VGTEDPTDQTELIVRAQSGDRPAFEELVRRTYVDTYSLAMRLTADEEDARDVVQETYLRAWKGIRRFRGDAALSTWLYRITANASYSHVEKRKRDRHARLDDSHDPVDARVAANPELATDSALLADRLGDALDELPPKLRVVVVLKDVYGLSHEAIAEELGISVAAAKVRLHRGRKRLRDELFEDQDRSAHAM
jgi:RNA polymerase sigma-70 factor (ECF subfamily)